jgi:TonB-linked SusC/RagA family outer membrane protein
MAKRLLGASILAFVLSFSMSGEALAQGTGTIAGTVVDSTSGAPLPGVNVVIVGTQQGAASDAEGRFEISSIQPGTYDVKTSFIGYEEEIRRGVSVSAGETTTLDFSLDRGQMGLDEVVVVGYGTQERQEVTGSIGSIEDIDEKAESGTYTSVGQLLQGQEPGLQANIATDADGRTGLQVRGTTSLRASNYPLIVTDGTPFYGDFADLNPNNIKSIDVLKGASAAAAYGASAANGVIEIRTKQGSGASKPTVSFEASTQLATPGRVVEPYSPDDYVRYRAAYLRSQNPDEADEFTPPDGTLKDEAFLQRLGLRSNEIQNYLDGNTIDWWDQVNRDAALRQQYDVSISGNPENFSYYTSVGYTANEAQVIGDRFETIRARLNLSAEPTDWIEVGINSRYARRDEGFLGASLGEAYEVSPLGNKFNEDGSLAFYPHDDRQAENPFLFLSRTGRELENLNHNLNGTLFGDFSLPYGFSFRTSWNSDYQISHSYFFNPSLRPLAGANARASRSESNDHRWHFTNRLTWEQTFGEAHEVEATLLYQVEARNSRYTGANNEGFALETLSFSNLEGGQDPRVSSYDRHSSATGAMARVHYGLLNRYLITATYRRDGYSAFGTENPFAYFPSLSVGWRAAEEPFLDVDAINNLKLRLSWGVNGNRSIGTYSALQRLSTNKYQYGGQTVTGIYANNLANEGLQWEETTQYNAGLDFGLFAGRVSGTVDAYYSVTENLILNRSLPDVTSFPSITTNLGQVDNRGIEVSLSTVNLSTETYNWESTLNFSLNRNEIVELYGKGNDDIPNRWFLGKSLYRVWEYETQGIYGVDDADQAEIYGKEPGDFRLLDVNGDSTLTPREDKTFQGYYEPRYRVSLRNQFTYENFTLSAFLNAHIGQDRIHNWHQHTGYKYGRMNRPDYPYWTREDPKENWARLGSDTSPGFNYWEDATFVRLQNLSLSYQVPSDIAGQITAQNINVYINAQNVATLTGYDGNDPETGGVKTPRLYSIGLNMTF